MAYFSFTDYLNFDDSPEPRVVIRHDQPDPYSELNLDNGVNNAIDFAILNDFDFDAFLGAYPDSESQAAMLYSSNPLPSDFAQQPSYSENIDPNLRAKYTLNDGKYANEPYDQTAASSSSALVRPVPSSAAPLPVPSSPETSIRSQPVVNPASMFPNRLPSAKIGARSPLFSYPSELGDQEESIWENQKASEQVSPRQMLEPESDQEWRELLATPEDNDYDSDYLLAELDAHQQSNETVDTQHAVGQASPQPLVEVPKLPRAAPTKKYSPNNNYFGHEPADMQRVGYNEMLPQIVPTPVQEYPPDNGYLVDQHERYHHIGYAQPANGQPAYPRREASVPAYEPEYDQNMDQPDSPAGDKKPKRVPKNKRSVNIAGFDPTEYYQPLPKAPDSWDPINPATKRPLFRYNKQGELEPTMRFTREQIMQYLENHPLGRNLTLWVQACPADSKRRYPDPDYSSKCRFEDCPVAKGTIEKGEYRVAFDEQWDKNIHKDPFHNAGYVHLFCLEKFFDFPSMCRNFNVQADMRSMPHEKKRMAIDKDGSSMKDIVNSFIHNAVPSVPRATEYQNTLCCALTLEKVKIGPQAHKNTREKRDGNNFEKHWNNLDWLVANLRRKKNGGELCSYPKPVPTAGISQGTKRKYRSEEEDDASIGRPEVRRRKYGLPEPEDDGDWRRSKRGRPTSSPATSPRRLQPLDRTSQHVAENWSKPKLPLITRQLPKCKAEDDDYSPDSFELTASTKRRRVVEQEPEDEPASRVRRRKVAKKPRKYSQD